MKIGDIGEARLIRRIARRAPRDRTVLVGIGDDAAVLEAPKGGRLLFACDMLVEGTHFTRRCAPYGIGWKALGVNVSDIAAMGGVPRWAVVSIGIDAKTSVKFIDEVYRGIAALARRFKVNIVGGDTNRSKNFVVDISLVGVASASQVTLRSGARPGDAILLTGRIGGSIKGRHLTFIPRVDEARELVERYKVSAMIDVSDGLLVDLGRLLDASSCGGRLFEGSVPVSRDAGSRAAAFSDGEDFELLFTMRPQEARRLLKNGFCRTPTQVSVIGEVCERKRGFKSRDMSGKERIVIPLGYRHFL